MSECETCDKKHCDLCGGNEGASDGIYFCDLCISDNLQQGRIQTQSNPAIDCVKKSNWSILPSTRRITRRNEI